MRLRVGGYVIMAAFSFKMAGRRDESDSDFSDEDSDYSDDEQVTSVDHAKSRATNMFANDGSFLEMFKKKMEEQQSNSEAGRTSNEDGEGETKNPNDKDESLSDKQCQDQKKTSLQSFVGKRRGGKVLPTGMVKKTRKDGAEKLTNKDDKKVEGRTDAWSQYMAEVRKYKERSCEDEGKTRPLVK